MPDRQLVALHSAFNAENLRLRRRLEADLVGMWRRLGSYDRPDIDRYAQRAAVAVTAAQRRMGTLTEVYLTRREALARGVNLRPQPVPASLITDEAIRGVPAVDVYRRTGPTVWTALSNRTPYDQAVILGAQRAVAMAVTDVQLAHTHTARWSGERRGITYYRRDIESRNPCGLCIVASTQRYRRGDLMPIHGGCWCSVSEIYGDTDPGQVIEPERLSNVHELLEERFGAKSKSAREFTSIGDEIVSYRDVLVTHQHGELGPVLGVRGHDFTSAADLGR